MLHRHALFLSVCTLAALWLTPGSSARAAGATDLTDRLQARAMLSLADWSAPASRPDHDPAHDFDFFYGRWQIHNRRLAKRLQGSHDWIEFEATDDCQPLAGGIGNHDTYRTSHWPHFVGVTLRLYNPAKRQWALYWVDNAQHPGVLQPPVVGGFHGKTGLFYGKDTYAGQAVTVRFTWSITGPDSAHWEQAFSTDGGKTWETNWVMDMTRLTDAGTAHAGTRAI
ncbi:MAG: hypothetical protein PVI56_07620 [Gammaproteobacteria bacterium]|jgi:hypothetical protein